MKIAETVTINDKDFLFEVDGEKFPFYISQRGPIVDRLADDLYTVDIEIFAMDCETKRNVPVTQQEYMSCQPVINGWEFPWFTTVDGWTMRCSSRTIPTVCLAFLARDVNGDHPVIDKRPDWEGRAIWDGNGNLQRDGVEPCGECGQDIHTNDMHEHQKNDHSFEFVKYYIPADEMDWKDFDAAIAERYGVELHDVLLETRKDKT